MAHVARINGKSVYSDKRMVAVVNTRVIFADGSWCDVSTGDIHNAGSGYVKIDGVDIGRDAEKITEGPKRVFASALEVRYINADVQVDTHSGSDIEYTITGSADRVKAIHANVRGNTLVIEGDGIDSSGSAMTVFDGGSHVFIQAGSDRVFSGDGIAISGGSVTKNVFGQENVTTVVASEEGENAVQVIVKVPEGTSVNTSSVFGNVVIGDTKGPLMVSAHSESVYAGSVTSAQLIVQGSGDVCVKEVSGTVMAQVQGSGEIEIEHGSMPSLTLTIQGSGEIKVDGSATTASLTVMGSGSIRVAHVQCRPMESVMGSGKIRVERVG